MSVRGVILLVVVLLVLGALLVGRYTNGQPDARHAADEAQTSGSSTADTPSPDARDDGKIDYKNAKPMPLPSRTGEPVPYEPPPGPVGPGEDSAGSPPRQ